MALINGPILLKKIEKRIYVIYVNYNCYVDIFYILGRHPDARRLHVASADLVLPYRIWDTIFIKWNGSGLLTPPNLT